MAAVEEDARLVMKALAEIEKTYPGPPHASSGPDVDSVARATGLPPERLNDAVEHLRHLGLAETSTGAGTRDHPFLHVKRTGAGRRSTNDRSPADAGAPEGGVRSSSEGQRAASEAAEAVLRALFESVLEGEPAAGRAAMTGYGLLVQTGLEPTAINNAVELLASRKLVDVTGLAGQGADDPWRFAAVKATPETQREYKTIKREENVDPRKVFVIHGRNRAANDEMFDFLRAINLDPYEFESVLALTGEASPYVGNAVELGIESARAAVALFTGDDLAHLRPELVKAGDPVERPAPQPRPNVLLETGMALATYKSKVVLVRSGELRTLPSNLAGRHWIDVTKDGRWRHDLADRLRRAGCDVITEGRTQWLERGSKLEEACAFKTSATLPAAPVLATPMHDSKEQALLFNAYIQERLEENGGNTITVNLREDRSATAWAGLTEEQLAGELKRMEKDRTIVVVDAAGAVFRIQRAAQTVSDSSVISRPPRGW